MIQLEMPQWRRAVGSVLIINKVLTAEYDTARNAQWRRAVGSVLIINKVLTAEYDTARNAQWRRAVGSVLIINKVLQTQNWVSLREWSLFSYPIYHIKLLYIII